MLHPPMPPPGGALGESLLPPAERALPPAKGATISGKSTVVSLPKAHEDKRGEWVGGRDIVVNGSAIHVSGKV